MKKTEEKINDLFEESKRIIYDKKIKDIHFPELNVITLLRKINDEVNLHSQMIATLLDPLNKLHKEFADSFFNILKLSPIKGDYKVLKESSNIDIFIETSETKVIIENKIDARDQNGQLEKYFESISKNKDNKNVVIVYLTKDGSDPSKASLGSLDLNQVQLISYENEILQWIADCISIAVKNPSYRETLIQYRNTILELLGRSDLMLEDRISKKIKESNEYMEAAHLIVDGFERAKIDIQLNFWVNLEKQINKTYTVSNLSLSKTSASSGAKKYDELLVKNFYKNQSNNKYFGILFPIDTSFELNDHKLCIYVEIERDVYWGIAILNKMENKIVNRLDNPDFENLFDKYQKKVNEIFSDDLGNDLLDKNEIQLYYQKKFDKKEKWVENRKWIEIFNYKDDTFLNFDTFTSKNIKNLANNEYMDKFVAKFSELVLKTAKILEKSL